MAIQFPNIDPVILHVYGPLNISWYSLLYVSGLFFTWLCALRIVKRGEKMNLALFDSLMNWMILGIIICARLGYVLLYDPMKYMHNPLDVFKTYEGGLSFHGGLIGGVTVLFLFAKKHKIEALYLTDVIAISVPIGLMLGRIGNLINQELYGRITTVPWAFIFPMVDQNLRHPSQIYEAIMEGLVLFCIMHLYAIKKLNLMGVSTGISLICYSTFRIIAEIFREPDVQIGFILNIFTLGQILSVPMFLFGIYLITRSNKIKNS